jgi:hypothetical protein
MWLGMGTSGVLFAVVFYVSSATINFSKNQPLWQMVSSGMLCHVALVRSDVSVELSTSFFRMTRIGEVGTTLAVTSNRRTLRSVCRLLVTASVVPTSPILVTLKKEALSSSKTSVSTRAKRRNIPEDNILHSHRRENLKSYNLCGVRVTYHRAEDGFTY